jgi:UDP-2,3-diacylglucosamine pyrophosphatase LpxH
MNRNKPIFVISDLHLGNGSRLDQFNRSGAEPLFWRFLDYVADQEGSLIIVGDLLELWRFQLSEVIDHRQPLLERLAEIRPVYIPGNHDSLAMEAHRTLAHPLFQYIRSPFTVSIGQRRYRFMHGHELDPFISQRLYQRSLPGCVSSTFIVKDRICRWTDNRIQEWFLRYGEYLMGMFHGWTGNPLHRIHPALHGQVQRKTRRPSYTLRVQKMLSRYLHDKDRQVYDVVVVGHSHQVGRYGNWYFNSGCWIGSSHSFLKILPDGHIEVFSWNEEGANPNQTVVWNHPAKMN